MRLIKANPKMFALIYGASGSGKTHLAATYCRLYPEEPVLLVDADLGSATLEAKDLADIKNLYAIEFEAFKDLNQIYELCEKNDVEEWIKAIPELKGVLTKPFKCIIWDTWSELQWVMSTELREKNKLLGKGLDYRQNIQLQHWGQMTDLNKLSVSSFKALPIESIFIMQAQVKEDAVTNQMIKGPAIHGKLTTELPAMFNLVIYTYNSPAGKFCATTLPKFGWPAKIRGKVGKDIDNPDMQKLISD